MSLSSKHAVVTGGATGIGLAITNALVEQGIMVTIMGRNKTRLDDIAHTNELINAVQVDVTDPGIVENAFTIAQNIKPISILINNAGIAHSAPFLKTNYATWQNILDVNLTGVYLTTSSFLTVSTNISHGRIINIVSTAGLDGFAYTSAYCAAKHGVMGLTKSLALELKDKGTTINAICPGFTNTDIVTKALENIINKTGRSKQEALSDILQTAEQNRLVEPEEIASEVIKLCSAESDAINGKTIVMDGN